MKKVNWQPYERVDINDLKAMEDLADEALRDALKTVFGDVTGALTNQDPPTATHAGDGTYSVTLPEGLVLYSGGTLIKLAKDYQVTGIVLDSNHTEAYITLDINQAEPSDELHAKENRVFWDVQQGKEVVNQVQTEVWPMPSFGWAYPASIPVGIYPNVTFVTMPPTNSVLYLKYSSGSVTTQWMQVLPQPSASKVDTVNTLLGKITTTLGNVIQDEWDQYTNDNLLTAVSWRLRGIIVLEPDNASSYGFGGQVVDASQISAYYDSANDEYYAPGWSLTWRDEGVPQLQDPSADSSNSSLWTPRQPLVLPVFSDELDNSDQRLDGDKYRLGDASTFNTVKSVPRITWLWGSPENGYYKDLKVWAWKEGTTCQNLPCFPEKVVLFIF